jgi:hypothetical protein
MWEWQEWSKSSDRLTPSSEGKVNLPGAKNPEVWESEDCEVFMDQGQEGNWKKEMFFQWAWWRENLRGLKTQESSRPRLEKF